MAEVNFAARLRRLRKKKKLTMYALARLVGVEPSTITRLERGEREPSLEVARRVMAVLGETLAVFDLQKK